MTTTIETENKVLIERFSDSNISKQYSMKLLKPDERKLSLQGYDSKTETIITIPKNQQASIRISHQIKSSEFSHIIIILEENSRAEIIEDSKSSKSSNLNTNFTEIFLKENSHLDFISVQNLSSELHNVTIKRADVSKNSKINWNMCVLGSSYTNTEASSILTGEGAESYNYCIFLGRNKEQFKISSSTIHKAPHTNSDILVKGVVKDKAKALYNGLVQIDRVAENCNAYQHEDALILNEGAEADSIPTLTIDNKEVKCSHGSTIGQVDKDKLFYLKTRGLSENQAKQIIVEGFFNPIIKKMKGIAHLKEEIFAKLK